MVNWIVARPSRLYTAITLAALAGIALTGNVGL